MSRRICLTLAALWLAALHIGAIAAGFIAPGDYAEQNRSSAFAPPTRLHFFDPMGRFHARPFVCRWSADPGTLLYSEDCSQLFPVQLFVTGARYHLFGVVESRTHLFGVAKPASVYLLGTDDFGRDQFTRFLYGAQLSLFSGLFACAISLTLGIIFGTLAGYYRGWADSAIMGAADLSLALPWLYLLLVARALLPLNTGPPAVFLTVVTIIGIVGWARPARLIRNTVLTARERGYVLLAKSFGGSDLDVLWTHIMPQIRSVAMTQVSLLIPRYILAEVVLSFLGLGVNEPTPSWGNLLRPLQQYSILSSYWWMSVPASLLLPTFMSYITISINPNEVETALSRQGAPQRLICSVGK
jgi:peptide/nickel transport system permease protein